MKRIVTVGLIVVLGLTLALSFGCSSKKTAANSGPQLAVEGAKVSGTLAEGYPEDLPLWEGAKVTKSKLTKKTTSVFEVDLTINSSFDKALYGFGEGYKKAGWDTQTVSEDKTNALISAIKGDESAAISINDNGDKTTTVVLSVQMK